MKRRSAALGVAISLGTVACSDRAGEGGDGGTDTASASGTDGDGQSTADSGGADGGDGSTSDDDGDTGDTGTGGTGTDGGDDPIMWEPCPVFTGGQGNDAECATVDVPIDWDDPGGDTIELFVKRVLGGDPGPQVWFLMGGPGGASHGYEYYADFFTSYDPTWSVYLLDHRGTGRSTRLGCAAEGNNTPGGYQIELEEWPDCIDELVSNWGADLAHFDTTNAAHDLGWLIERTREPDQIVHVHGGSYGTYWAHRYLQIFPDQADGVSMLGVVSPDYSFTRYDESFETVGRAFMEACGADVLCSSKLGSGTEPVTRMEQVMDDIEAGHCAEAVAAGLDRTTLRAFFGKMLGYMYYERVLIPATVYRLERCSVDDVAALQSLAVNAPDPLAGLLNDGLFSRVINHNIKFGEMYHAPIPTIPEIEAYLDQAMFALGTTATRQVYDLWPAYEEDEHCGEFADTNVPLLMMNGEFDAPSNLAQAQAMAEAFTGPNQRFIEVPFGSHTWDSPVQGGSCTLSIFYYFASDPNAPLLDCIEDIDPFDFAGTTDLAQQVFGKDDLWEG